MFGFASNNVYTYVRITISLGYMQIINLKFEQNKAIGHHNWFILGKSTAFNKTLYHNLHSRLLWYSNHLPGMNKAWPYDELEDTMQTEWIFESIIAINKRARV